MDHSTWLAAAGGLLAGGVAPWPAKAVWRLLRGSGEQAAKREAAELERLAAQLAERDDLVDVLRKALDKHWIRYSAVVSACELLIALAGMVEKPTPAMVRMRDQAKRLLEDARTHLTNINTGGHE